MQLVRQEREEPSKPRGELLVAVEDEESLAEQKAVERIGLEFPAERLTLCREPPSLVVGKRSFFP